MQPEISIHSLLPQQIPARLISDFEERIHTKGPHGEESIAVKLWQSRPLDSGAIYQLGMILEPPRKEKNGINGMVRDVATIMDDLAKVSFDEGLHAKLKRYYVAGDYSRKTGVLHFNSTHLIGDVNFGNMSEQEIIDKLYLHLKNCFDHRRKLKDSMEDVNVCDVELLGKRILITNANYTIAFVVANLDHLGSVGREKGHGATVKEIQSALERYTRLDGSRNYHDQLIHLIQEPHDRYVDSMSPKWHAFVRATKYICQLLLPPLVPEEALETLCVKALLSLNQYHGEADLEKALELVIKALADPTEMKNLNRVSAPDWAFQQDVFQKSIPQPPVSAPIGDGPVVHHLFLPGYTLWKPRPAEIEILRSILSPLPPRITFAALASSTDKEKKDEHVAHPERRYIARVVRRSFAWTLFILLVMCFSLLILMESPNGTMPHGLFKETAENGQNAMIQATNKLLAYGYQPVVDSTVFDYLERGLEVSFNAIEDFPAAWQMTVPVGTRKAVVASRDYYKDEYLDWGMREMRPYIIHVRGVINSYL